MRTSLLPGPPESGDCGDSAQNVPDGAGVDVSDASGEADALIEDDADVATASEVCVGLSMGVADVDAGAAEVSTGVCDATEDCEGCG